MYITPTRDIPPEPLIVGSMEELCGIKERVLSCFGRKYITSLVDLPSHVAVAESLDDLAQIHNKGINLVLFPRQQDDEIVRFLESMDQRNFPYGNYSGSLCGQKIKNAFKSYSSFPGCGKFLDDVMVTA